MNFKNIMLATFALAALSVDSISSSRPVSAVGTHEIMSTNESIANTAGGGRVAVPFKGTFEGYDASIGLDLHQESVGTATLLGRFALTLDVTINVIDFTDAGTAHWVAANGDSIYTTVEGFAIPGPEVFTITETHTISGGTGRFEGAEGSFTVVRAHVVAPSDDGTHATFGSFRGTITSPGMAQ